MVFIVTIKDDPARVHRDQYEKIGKLFEPDYKLSRQNNDSYIIEALGTKEKGTWHGKISISENNKDVIIKGNPKLFLNIAKEIEKLGYLVVIEY